ncbi:type II toxin-antitoxin system prevent-host-death family antitoxin [uncultured Thiocystis sp.]|jgi:prevent-host-death family protein|uniref:type II toxin-antitoxin system Phd/YefM family antitoxin n=1 Tax=uncultured Thiocystis sp. TaxID=1202134 RepID=UPI0025EDCA10|nr:type II toxin-antitoxin system prevent-host-death family antitoxin [uncultured Thiocystis sp.]
MKTTTLAYAESHLASLVSVVESGEEILITRQGRPVARIVPEIERAASPAVWSDLHHWVTSGQPLSGPTVAELREQDLL